MADFNEERYITSPPEIGHFLSSSTSFSPAADLFGAAFLLRSQLRGRDPVLQSDAEGKIHLPIRIENGNYVGRLHLLPVNYFTRVFTHLMEKEPAGDIFNITGESPAHLGQIIEWTREFLDITGLEAVSPEEFTAHPRNGLETLFHSHTQAYRPYMQDTRRFSTKKTDAFLKNSDIRCPAFDEAVFTRCMAYAVSADWGKRLFPQESMG